MESNALRLRYFRIIFFIWAGLDCLFLKQESYIYRKCKSPFTSKSVMNKPQAEGKVNHVCTRACEWSGERSGHISFRAESAFLKIPLRSLNPKCPLVICWFENPWNRLRLSNSLSKLMFLKANSKILWRLADVLIDNISPQFWSILILENVFLLFTPQNNSL